MKNQILFFSLLLWAAACAKTTLPVASDKDAVNASEKWPGITSQELAQGQALYEQHCGNCHKLYHPASRTEKEWNSVVPPMADKAKIDDKSETLILKYLVTMSISSKE
jgi:cytochrome c5